MAPYSRNLLLAACVYALTQGRAYGFFSESGTRERFGGIRAGNVCRVQEAEASRHAFALRAAGCLTRRPADVGEQMGVMVSPK